MAHVRKVETNKKRNGKPVAHYEVRWVEFVLVTDDTGQLAKRKKYRQETYPTKADADDRLREIERDAAQLGRVTGREARLEPFAMYGRAFLDALEGSIKARTLAEYRRILDTYVLPEFATRPIGSITPADARRFRADLVSRGLARGTIKHAFDVFRRVLDTAVTDGALPANPAASVPRLRQTDTQPFTPHPLSAEQVAAVAGHVAARVPVYGLVVLFAAYTGLRAAELAGLEIQDITLAPGRGSVRVERTKRRARREIVTGTPKSRKSRRTVPLDAWLADDLRDYLSTHPRRDDPTAPLFPARHGRNAVGMPRKVAEAPDTFNWAAPLDPNTVYATYLRPALRAHNLPVTTPARPETTAEDGTAVPAAPPERGVRWHDLRHTFAVLSLSAGAHYMQVSKWLGHESYVTTLTIYADYIDTEEGGKAVPLARPVAPAQSSTQQAECRVISLADRRRSAG